MPSVETPCIGICRLDDEGEMCLGCYRTLDEIGAWRDADEARRRLIIERAAGRRGRAVGEEH
ncbi:DUF1289 domain-containing protein [Sphingomonas sp. NBWT7]|uniref:DUF1289 domain-containing protein n=1 Tax=Sphingomonas sp. NBWT7 TaxID=2596913 RepID=UPI001623D0CC|nr:DUF1289 domain-containing protein [Sphingomonas sp. NBWT7]QNE33409.1 DUF1289 domain-containing protein [Sphingomonas sp. NBWT7]